MKTWVGEEAESARVYERLQSTALLHEKGEAGLWDQPDLGVALKWRSIQKPNPAWAQRYNAAFGPAMAFLDASQARAEAAEDAKARRRRVWVFSIAVVFFVMLTGILSWVHEELAQADVVARAARSASAELQWLRAMVDLHRARVAGTAAGGLAGAAWKVCAQRPPERGLSTRARLLDKLCEPKSTLTDVERKQIGIYEHVLEGRWRDASEALSPSRAGIDAEDVLGLLGRLAAMRSPTDRSDRNLLRGAS